MKLLSIPVYDEYKTSAKPYSKRKAAPDRSVNRQLMSGAAQLLWGDDGSIGLRSPLALAQGVIGSKRNTPKKRRMYRVHTPARRLAFQFSPAV